MNAESSPTTDVPTATPSRDALTRYARSIRAARIRYAATLTLAGLVIVALVRIAYSRGEIAHVTLSTVPAPPPPVTAQPPSIPQYLAWTSSDHVALGSPVWGGTLITQSVHSVRGRDASSSAITWSYTRTDRQVCQAIQDQGVTLAIFELRGNCDEITALDSSTGARR